MNESPVTEDPFYCLFRVVSQSAVSSLSKSVRKEQGFMSSPQDRAFAKWINKVNSSIPPDHEKDYTFRCTEHRDAGLLTIRRKDWNPFLDPDWDAEKVDEDRFQRVQDPASYDLADKSLARSKRVTWVVHISYLLDGPDEIVAIQGIVVAVSPGVDASVVPFLWATNLPARARYAVSQYLTRLDFLAAVRRQTDLALDRMYTRCPKAVPSCDLYRDGVFILRLVNEHVVGPRSRRRPGPRLPTVYLMNRKAASMNCLSPKKDQWRYESQRRRLVIPDKVPEDMTLESAISRYTRKSYVLVIEDIENARVRGGLGAVCAYIASRTNSNVLMQLKNFMRFRGRLITNMETMFTVIFRRPPMRRGRPLVITPSSCDVSLAPLVINDEKVAADSGWCAV